MMRIQVQHSDDDERYDCDYVDSVEKVRSVGDYTIEGNTLVLGAANFSEELILFFIDLGGLNE